MDLYTKNMQVLVYTSTYTILNNTGRDVTGFSLPMMASTDYEFEFEVIYQTSSTSRGIGLGVNGPASPNLVLVFTEIPTALNTVVRRMQRAYATGVAPAAADAATTNIHCRCYGKISNGTTAGNLILWATKSSNGGTVQILPNSWMKMWRINPTN